MACFPRQNYGSSGIVPENHSFILRVDTRSFSFRLELPSEARRKDLEASRGPLYSRRIGEPIGDVDGLISLEISL